MKHVVMDARAARPEQLDGLGVYIRQLMPRLVAAADFDVTLLIDPRVRSFWADSAARASLVPSQCQPMWLRQNWEIPRLLGRLRGADLFFYPAHDPPLGLTSPFVFTVHDLICHQLPPYFERNNTIKTAYSRLVTGRGLKRARAVFAVSEATRSAIGDVFGADAKAKTVVTPNGISPIPAAAAAAAQGEPGEKPLLYVGTDRPHKNLVRLVTAYGQAARSRPDLPRLQLVGALRSEAMLRRKIDEVGMNGRITLKGHVDDAQLELAYAGALALVMPSLAEGFGIPIVEAMARGLPVITSRVSAAGEVAGDAALLVDPTSTDDIARALVRIHEDDALRSELSRLGRARSAQFTWERCASTTLGVIRELLSS